MKKRILSIIMVMCMVLTLTPSSVMAKEDVGTNSSEASSGTTEVLEGKTVEPTTEELVTSAPADGKATTEELVTSKPTGEETSDSYNQVSQYDQLIVMQPGDTLDVGTFDTNVVVKGFETKVQINSPGTYTLTGKADGARRTGRIQINSDCTLILDNLYFNSRVCLDDNKDYYYGGTQGAFEIADGKTVNLQMKGYSQIVCTQFYGVGVSRLGILLGENSTLNVEGDGTLYIGSCIGSKMGLTKDNAAKVNMINGTLESIGFYNGIVDSNKNDLQRNSNKSLYFTYIGGSYYHSRMFMNIDYKYRIISDDASNDVYSVTIPAKGSTKIKRGVDGEESTATAINDTVVVWLDYTDLAANSPLFYVQSEDGYHCYQAKAISPGDHLLDAELMDDEFGITGTLSDADGRKYDGATLSFKDSNDNVYTCKTSNGGKYSSYLPTDEYTVSVDIDNQVYEIGEVSVTAGTPNTYNITLPYVGGTVKDAAGNVYKDATITFTNGNNDNYICTTGSDGSYGLCLLPGTYSVKVNLDGQIYSWSSCNVVADTSSTYNITLPCINGTVKDAVGTSYENATITFTNTDGVDITCNTTTNGNYLVCLPVGVYTYKVDIEDQTFDDGIVNITAGNKITNNIKIPCVDGTITDDVTTEKIDGAYIIVSNGSDNIVKTTDENGYFKVIIPVGTENPSVKVTASKLGYGTKWGNGTFSNNKATVDISLTGAALLDNVDVYSEADLVALSLLGEEALNDKTINIKNDITISDDSMFTSIKKIKNATINGENHKILNLKTPLFADVETCIFNDVHIEGNISYAGNTGAFAIKGNGADFINCSFVGSLSSTVENSYMGSFIGWNGLNNITFTNCMANLEIRQTKPAYVGGFVGMHRNGSDLKTYNCYVNMHDMDSCSPDINVSLICCTHYGGQFYTNTYATASIQSTGNYYFAKFNTNLYMYGFTYNKTSMPELKDSLNYTEYGMDESLMTAFPGTEGSLIDKLNKRVTVDNGYFSWYLQSDGFPGFTKTNKVSVTSGTLKNNESAAYYANGETVTIKAAPVIGKEFTSWTVAASSQAANKVILANSKATTTTFTMKNS